MYRYTMLIFLLLPNLVIADVSEKQAQEVRHLLEFVKISKCTLTRNGSQHSGEVSAKHIKKKYNYYRDDIKSTEDFIKFAATKSALSGNFYTVSCPDKNSIKTKDWLLIELKRYRLEKSMKKQSSIDTICTDPRPQICTMEYLPVCAMQVDGTTKTYPSACSACAKSIVVSHKPGEC